MLCMDSPPTALSLRSFDSGCAGGRCIRGRETTSGCLDVIWGVCHGLVSGESAQRITHGEPSYGVVVPGEQTARI